MKSISKILIISLLIATSTCLNDNYLAVIFPQFSFCCGDIEGEESQPKNCNDTDIDTFETDRLCSNSYSEGDFFPVIDSKERITDPSSLPGFYFSIWHPPKI